MLLLTNYSMNPNLRTPCILLCYIWLAAKVSAKRECTVVKNCKIIIAVECHLGGRFCSRLYCNEKFQLKHSLTRAGRVHVVTSRTKSMTSRWLRMFPNYTNIDFCLSNGIQSDQLYLNRRKQTMQWRSIFTQIHVRKKWRRHITLQRHSIDVLARVEEVCSLVENCFVCGLTRYVASRQCLSASDEVLCYNRWQQLSERDCCFSAVVIKLVSIF